MLYARRLLHCQHLTSNDLEHGSYTLSSEALVIKVIFFDYDGVLTCDKTGSLTTQRFLSRHTGISYVELARAFTPYNEALNTGQTTYAEIWPSVCAELNQQIPFALLTRAFESTPANEAMFELARAARHHCAVGIITDNKQDRIDCLKRCQRLDQLFAPIVVSAEVGSMKVAPQIFDRALQLAGVKPDESVFIDNTSENLAAPAALGMRTIYFDDERNDVAGLARSLDTQFGIFIARKTRT